MEFRYIGDIVGTHGIKGEIRIISDSKFKENIFVTSNTLYIGKRKTPLLIKKYRHHKIYDMVTFEGLNDINDVLPLKGEEVYISKEEIKVNGYFDEDIIGLDVYFKDELVGRVDCILKTKAHDILSVIGEKYHCLIPWVETFVIDISLDDKRIDVVGIEELLNEN